MELDADNKVVTKYIRGNGDLLKAEDGDGNLKWYYVSDTHGNIVKLLYGSYAVMKSYEYDEFGNEKNIDTNDTNPFRYCGEYYDTYSGTVYLRARNYSPGMGRFLQMDSYAGDYYNLLSLNLGTYCENDAVNYVDPSGHRPVPNNLSNLNLYSGMGKIIYVTAAQLKEFGWKDTSSAFIQKLNSALIRYKITNKNSIALFMAIMAEESGWGTKTIEQGPDSYFATKKYSKNERGAGYIQITWRDTHLKFLKEMGDNFSGVNTAKYIADNYPVEAAAWFWSNAPKTGAGNLNAYVSKNGGSLGIFLNTQYFVNALVTDKNGNVPKAFMNDLTSIRNGASFTIFCNSLNINRNSWRLPYNWASRKAAYDKAIKIFK